MNVLVKDLIDGSSIRGIYRIGDSKEGATKGSPPKPYVDLTLMDKTGEVLGKLWDTSMCENFAIGNVIELVGKVSSYNGKLQIVVQNYQVAATDTYNVSDFIRTAPVPFQQAWEDIIKEIHTIEPVELRSVVVHCLKKCGDKFSSHPAAKSVHHSFHGGLYYHVLRMLQLADTVCQQRPFLNASLVKAGVILHDLAKTEEMMAQGGVVSDYTTRGQMIGHIAMISSWIVEACYEKNLDKDSEIILAIQHIVLSHHGKLEWGSPVVPQLPEAVALHLIDQMDAKLQACEDALSAMGDGAVSTPPLLALDKAKLHRLNF